MFLPIHRDLYRIRGNDLEFTTMEFTSMMVTTESPRTTTTSRTNSPTTRTSSSTISGSTQSGSPTIPCPVCTTACPTVAAIITTASGCNSSGVAEQAGGGNLSPPDANTGSGGSFTRTSTAAIIGGIIALVALVALVVAGAFGWRMRGKVQLMHDMDDTWVLVS